MNRLPSLLKTLACVLLAGAVAPAASAAPLKPLPDFNSPQSNPARPPVVVIVASDNVTILHRISCTYRQNVGSCLDAASVQINQEQVIPEEQAPPEQTSAYDDDDTCTFVAGRARIGSYLGAYATAGLNYDYYDIYIESDLQLRAAQ